MKEIIWTPIADLKPHPKNVNKHPEDQIDRLAEIIKFQGMRVPVIVSKLSGFIVAGHGRVIASQRAGLDKVPVIFQDFPNSDAEYAFIVSDNAIGSWSELDLKLVNLELPNLELPSVDLLGIKDFKLDTSEIEFPELSGKEPGFQQRTFILSNEQNDFLNEAMEKAAASEDCSDELNQNKNGNILAAIMKRYVHG